MQCYWPPSAIMSHFLITALWEADQAIKKTYHQPTRLLSVHVVFFTLKYSRRPEATLSLKGFLCEDDWEGPSRAALPQLICSHTCDFSTSPVKMWIKRYYVSDLKPSKCTTSSSIENSQSISHIPSSISKPHLLFTRCMLVSKGPDSTKRACVFSMGGANWNPAGIKPLLSRFFLLNHATLNQTILNSV